MTTSEIGKLISSTRKRKGIKQVELGRMAKVDVHALSKLENGGYCHYATLESICDKLGLQVVISQK